MTPRVDRYRLRRLLLDRALEGLDAREERELQALGAPAPALPDDYELAAAAVYLALGGAHDPLPETLRARLEHRASEMPGHDSELNP